MNLHQTFALAALAGTLISSAAPADRASDSAGSTAPVLKSSEPSDSVLVTLPGPRIRFATPKPAASPVVPDPEAVAQPVSSGPVSSAVWKQPAAKDQNRPLLKRTPKPVFPADFQKDSALFCQLRIGQWSRPDAYNLLGEAIRERPAYSDDKTENGHIYAFSDPTGRYRALELDFAADTGLLRTVFVYPWSMTWIECRELWGAKVTATAADHGRKFYSYLNHRLDVLVDPGGKVVSLGFY